MIILASIIGILIFILLWPVIWHFNYRNSTRGALIFCLSSAAIAILCVTEVCVVYQIEKTEFIGFSIMYLVSASCFAYFAWLGYNNLKQAKK
ncbi:MAG: hypothetical protein HQ536_03370 [Parcubacteria group bacterium]|nr:hypothetical protein [Parcubacteria group bacterium]